MPTRTVEIDPTQSWQSLNVRICKAPSGGDSFRFVPTVLSAGGSFPPGPLSDPFGNGEVSTDLRFDACTPDLVRYGCVVLFWSASAGVLPPGPDGSGDVPNPDGVCQTEHLLPVPGDQTYSAAEVLEAIGDLEYPIDLYAVWPNDDRHQDNTGLGQIQTDYPDQRPAPPGNLSGVGDCGAGTVVLNWDSVECADSYRIYRDGNPTAFATVTAPLTTYTAHGQSATVAWTVTAVCSCGGESAQSAPVTVTVCDGGAVPDAPILDLQGPCSGRLVVFQWSAVTDADPAVLGYQLYLDDGSGGSPRDIPVMGADTTTVTVGHLRLGHRYRAWVKAYNSVGLSAESNPITVIPCCRCGWHLTERAAGTWNAQDRC